MAEWAKPIEEEVDIPTRFSFESSGSSVFAEESHCLQYFGSAFWKYPVHIFVGSIIKGAELVKCPGTRFVCFNRSLLQH